MMLRTFSANRNVSALTHWSISTLSQERYLLLLFSFIFRHNTLEALLGWRQACTCLARQLLLLAVFASAIHRQIDLAQVWHVAAETLLVSNLLHVLVQRRLDNVQRAPIATVIFIFTRQEVVKHGLMLLPSGLRNALEFIAELAALQLQLLVVDGQVRVGSKLRLASLKYLIE